MLFKCTNIVESGSGGGDIDVYINDEKYNEPLSLKTLSEEEIKSIIKDQVKQVYINNGGLDTELDLNTIKESLPLLDNYKEIYLGYEYQDNM